VFASITMGQYLPGRSAVHRLDPRTKILVTLAFLVLVLAGRGWTAIAACATFTALGLAWARLPPGPLWRGFRPILALVLLTALTGVLLTPGVSLWRLGPLSVSREGLNQGLAAGARLALLVVQSTVLTITTAPLDLSAAAERLLRPFQRLGVPVQELALMSSIALRFLPTLADEADRLAKAQAARGADWAGTGRQRVRAVLALLVPLLISVLRRADELAMAMESRGYQGGQGRTHWRQSRAGRADLLAATIVAALAACVIWTRLRGPLP